MPIDTQHNDYVAALPQWRKCRDAATGQDAVHAAGELYLAKLAEQTPAEYKAYRDRALYYNACGRTIDGLSGMVFRRLPGIEIPASLEYFAEDVDTAGTPLLGFCEQAVEELLRVGRIGLLADFPPTQGVLTMADEVAIGARPYLNLVHAESVINWRCERINNRQQLSLVVIAEKHDIQKDDYTWTQVDQLRALRLVDGRYIVELWRRADGTAPQQAQWNLIEVLTPSMGGAPLKYIPFLFCGPMGVGETVDKSPVLDLANVNLSHYKSSADYEHGLHFTGLPTPIVTGHTFEPTDKFALGSTQVRGFGDPQAKAFYLEFTGQGLTNLAERLKEKQEMMASLGARMLGAQKRTAETAETAAIHRSGENGVLASIANSASAALTKALTWCAEWVGVSEAFTVSLNTEYLAGGLTAQEVTALVGAWQAGAIAHETLYENLQRGEIAQQDIEFADEQARIAADGPALGAMADPMATAAANR